MIGLLQRVSSASVAVDGTQIAAIQRGLLVLIGVQRDDAEPQAERLLERLLSYRVFPDAQGKMNLSLREVNGGLLLAPQFTLAADTQKGTRAGFSTAAEPARAKALYEYLLARAQKEWPQAVSGVFGAEMKVSLVNDGPVTFWLEAR